MKTRKDRLWSMDGIASTFPGAVILLRSTTLCRSLAARARHRGDRTTDVFYRRAVCELNPGDASNWIQFAHSLKELGFHDKAQEAYLRAAHISPGSADVYVQLAHLAKIRGDFLAAEGFFVTARERGHPDIDDIGSEIAILRRIDNADVYANRIRGLDPEGVHIYLSAPVASIRENDKHELAADLGKSDYSYAFAMRGFVAALEMLGHNFTILDKPEFVSDIRDRSNARVNVHIGFYPPERLRLLKGAYNINCFAWEFDRLRASSEVMGYHAFLDQASMLDVVDELWVPSTHGVKAIAKSLTKPVHMVPAPILDSLRPVARDDRPNPARVRHLAQSLTAISWQPLAVFARVQAAMNDEARRREATLADIIRQVPGDRAPLVFLTVLNVHDFRKQLYPMLQAFVEFGLDHPEAILLVKMTTPDRGKLAINTFLLMDQISNAGELPRPLVSDRIWITDQILSRDELNHLYDLSAFYACTSYAEGQNLPLLEAMGRGVVPVSVGNTAMADYINEQTAVPIRSEPRPLGPRLASRYGLYGLKTNFVDAADARDGFERANALAGSDYASRSAAALSLVQRDYGVGPVAKALDRVISLIETGGKS